jgi:serine protease Do
VTLEILRNGQVETKQVTLEQRPTDLAYSGGGRKPMSQGPLRGVAVQNLTPALRQELQLPANVHGVVVTNIDPESPAAQRLEPGDVITSINQQPVNSIADYNKLAADAKGKALLRVIHQGQAAFVVITSEGDGQ